MEEILIYMLIKHRYIWDEVYNALRQKEPIDIKDVKDEYIKLCCKYVTVINEKYPLYLHDVLKPHSLYFMLVILIYLVNKEFVLKVILKPKILNT
jgi:DNA processing protein